MEDTSHVLDILTRIGRLLLAENLPNLTQSQIDVARMPESIVFRAFATSQVSWLKRSRLLVSEAFS